jgi:hypothetical protein
MGALLFSIMTVTLVFSMVAVDVEAGQGSAENAAELSPFAPPLVREGDFAVRMAAVLGLGDIEDEDDAGLLLSEIGLSPRNGWIADYPVTPMMLAELREAVIASTTSGKLALSEAEALEAFDRLALELGLSVDETAEREYARQQPADDASAEEDPYRGPSGTQGYYTTEGPPVMTYYPPPSHYYDYYDWVPYPFYFSRSYFSGFFILHDFRRAHKFHHHFDRKHHHKHFGFHNRFKHKFISNHHWNRGLGKTELFRPHGAERIERFGTINSGRDPRFSSERREFRHSHLRGGREAFIRSSPHARPGNATPSWSARSFPHEGGSSIRPFGSRHHNDGMGRGSFRSFHHQGRGFSGSGGGGGRGRR